MSKQNIAKRRTQRKSEEYLKQQRRLSRRTQQKSAAGFTSAAMAPATRQKASQRWQAESTGPQLRWNVELAAMLALCLTSVMALAIPACGGGSKSHVRSFREASVEITSVPKDAEFYLNDIQGSPVVTTDSDGQRLSATAYHPYGAVRYQKGRRGDPWGFVGNEEDRGSALSDFHARRYRPELGIFASVDPQSLFQPEKIIGQPSRMYSYAYAAGNPVSQSDQDGKDYVVSVLNHDITVTFPVNLHGAYTAREVSLLQRSFDEAFGSKAYSYTWGKTTYDVKFRLDVAQKGAPVAELPPVGTNKVTVVPGRYLGYNAETKRNILGAATCVNDSCRTATFPRALFRDGLTVPHELAHLTGMQHDSDPNNLMYETNAGSRHKSLSQSQINTVVDRAMMQMPEGAKSFSIPIKATPMSTRNSDDK